MYTIRFENTSGDVRVMHYASREEALRHLREIWHYTYFPFISYCREMATEAENEQLALLEDLGEPDSEKRMYAIASNIEKRVFSDVWLACRLLEVSEAYASVKVIGKPAASQEAAQ
jgi:hypothetical protein